jgi:hypothetical protein
MTPMNMKSIMEVTKTDTYYLLYWHTLMLTKKLADIYKTIKKTISCFKVVMITLEKLQKKIKLQLTENEPNSVLLLFYHSINSNHRRVY